MNAPATSLDGVPTLTTPHPPATRRASAWQGGDLPTHHHPHQGTTPLLTYHEILHRNNLTLAGTYTPSTSVLTRDITYLLTLIDRYARLVAAARARETTHA